MEVHNQINLLIEERNLTKREFAKKLIALEPKSKRTGEIMSEKTVYAYLSGAVIDRLEHQMIKTLVLEV